MAEISVVESKQNNQVAFSFSRKNNISPSQHFSTS